MARIEQVTLACDLDGSENGVTTVELSVGDTTVQIDLCPGHAAELGAVLVPYVSAGRPVRARPRRQKPPRTAARRQHAAEVRAWGKRLGRCSDRGRIPVDVIADYNAAHGVAR